MVKGIDLLKLELISGPQQGRLVRISDDAPVPIGRNFGRLRLHDSRVSKNHAEIVYAGNGAWVLRDLGSSNGSYVNKQRLTTLAELEKGDVLQFGRVVVRVLQADGKGITPVGGPTPASDETAMVGAELAGLGVPGVTGVLDEPDAEADPVFGAADGSGEVDLDALFAEADRDEDAADGIGERDVDELIPARRDAPPVAEASAIDAPGVETPLEAAASDAPEDDNEADKHEPTANRADDTAEATGDEPDVGLDDQVRIDDDTPDAGKAPGTTLVLPNETLAAAAGSDRSTAPLGVDDASDDDADAAVSALGDSDAGSQLRDAGSGDDDAIGLAREAEHPSVFDHATDNTPPAVAKPSDTPDHDHDLIRIHDDTPVQPPAQRGSAAPASPTEAPPATEPEHDAAVDAAAQTEEVAAAEDDAPSQAETIAQDDDAQPTADVENEAKAEVETAAEAEAEAVADEALPESPFALDDLGHSSGSWLVAGHAPEDAAPAPVEEVARDAEAGAQDVAEAESAEAAESGCESRGDSGGNAGVEAVAEAEAEVQDEVQDEAEPEHGPHEHVEQPLAESSITEPAPPAPVSAEDLGAIEAAEAEAEADEAPTDDAAEPEFSAEAVASADAADDAAEQHEAKADATDAAEASPPAADVGYLRAALANLADDDPDADAADQAPTEPPIPATPDALRAALADDARQHDDDTDAPVSEAVTETETADAAPPVSSVDEDAQVIEAIAEVEHDEHDDHASTAEDTPDGFDLAAAEATDDASKHKDPGDTDFDAPSPASLTDTGSADAIARELDDDERTGPGELLSETNFAPAEESDAGRHDRADDSAAGNPALNPTSTLPPSEPRTSRRSVPDWNRRAKRKRAAVVVAVLLLLAAAGLYLGVVNPDLIAGRDTTTPPNDNTQPTNAGPNHTPGNNPANPGQGTRLPNNNPGTNPGNTPGNNPGTHPGTNPGNTPPDHPYVNTTNYPPNAVASAGDRIAPDPFAPFARVIGANALAGRTTDDPNVARPTPGNPGNPGNNPGETPGSNAGNNPGNNLPPVVVPNPGGSTTPTPGTPGNPGNPGSNPGSNPGTTPGNNTPPANANGGDNTNTDPLAPTDGERLVFLVDCSGSLVDSLPQMLLWLREALDTLGPDKRFAIIFFKKDTAIEAEPAGLKPFTRALQRELNRDWLDPDAAPVLPSGRSDPEKALELALSYEPSDIYVLSDESFGLRTGETTPEEAVTLVAQTLGETDIRVHGVQFFYDDRDGTLEALAERYNGTYEFVAEARHPDRDPIDLLEELENRNP